MFADLFYLPFSHGPSAIRLLELGHWLREYSYVCGPNPSDLEVIVINYEVQCEDIFLF